MNDHISGILENLKKTGVWGAAVVDREGNLIESNSLESLNEITFSIMSATMVGSAQTINSELKRGDIKQIQVDLENGKLVVLNAGRKKLLSVVVDKEMWNEDISEKIKRAAVEIRGLD